jgi:general secretion pathway protein E
VSKSIAAVIQPPSRGAGFLEYLETEALLDATAIQRLVAARRLTPHSIDALILELGLLPEVQLADTEARFLGLSRMRSGDLPESLMELPGIDAQFLLEKLLLPLGFNNETLVVATAKPFDREAIDGLSFFLGHPVELRIATASEIQGRLQQFLSDASTTPGGGGLEVHESDVERLKDAARDQPTVKLLNRIVAAAIAEGASDIHIEPQNDQLRIRFRVDGTLRIHETLPLETSAGLISRTKILARLNIAEQRLPQDGRMRLAVRGREIDFRVSSTPIVNGESVALRVLDRHELPLDFASLGFSQEAAEQLQRLTSLPNGIVLVTGPTGSGKTTTLYAALKLLNRTASKLFTVEDPVEYQLSGVNQIQVNPQIGLDFAQVLRSVLRQDPDVIMVGEIRDLETARIAIQAALTGHLVLSTLHTNSAVATLARLSDMGLENYLMMSCINAIVAQRLVRRLCNACKIEMILPAKMAGDLGLPSHAQVMTPCGCAQCGGTGYRGRIVVYEILELSTAVRQAMARQATLSEISEIGTREGMQSLYVQAMGRVLAGETSIEEVLRTVTGPEL